MKTWEPPTVTEIGRPELECLNRALKKKLKAMREEMVKTNQMIKK